MDINSFPNRPYYFPYENDVYIAKPNLVLVVILFCLFGPFWLIISLIRGTLRDDLWEAAHPTHPVHSK